MVDKINSPLIESLKKEATFHLNKALKQIEKITVLYATEPRHKDWVFLIEKYAKMKMEIDALTHELKWSRL